MGSKSCGTKQPIALMAPRRRAGAGGPCIRSFSISGGFSAADRPEFDVVLSDAAGDSGLFAMTILLPDL